MPSEFYDEIIYPRARCLPNIKEPQTTPQLRLHARDARSEDTARGTHVRSLAMPKMSKPGGGRGHSPDGCAEQGGRLGRKAPGSLRNNLPQLTLCPLVRQTGGGAG